MTRALAILCLAVVLAGTAAAQERSGDQSTPPLKELRLEGATVYSRDDVQWLLRLRDGAPLPGGAAAAANALQDRYERDGYSHARVTAAFDNGRLTLTVDEGRIDDIEIAGVAATDAARIRRLLGVNVGDVYNTRVMGRAAARLRRQSGGALVVGRPRHRYGKAADESLPDDITLDRRGTRNVLIVPIRVNNADLTTSLGSGREEVFSPVDGLTPALNVSATIFDPGKFNHAIVDGYVSYKFARDNPGYSVGGERPFFSGPVRLFAGAEAHDVTASDDRWRTTSFEQTMVSLAFKNSFRDYYRRRGAQIFGVIRAADNNEFSLMARWDRHSALPNATSYSFFRDDAELRPPLPVRDQHVNAFVLGYTFDTRPLTGAGTRATYARHRKDDLFGFASRQQPGFRFEWTSEIAGHALGGDAAFERHIANARGYIPLPSRTLLALRGLFGVSRGELPVERLFGLGGIGSVHGYAFKEVAGTRMALLNAEYRIGLTPSAQGRERDGASIFAFYDAGRVGGPDAPRRWLNGVGFGVGAGGLRLEFGFRADDIPGSRQILVRFAPTF